MEKNSISISDVEKNLKAGKFLHMPKEVHVRIRTELSSYADFHTVQSSSPFGNAFSFLNIIGTRRIAFTVIAIVLLLGIGAGTTYASEGTLPGDTLYPVKVGVAEPLQGAFIPDVKGKAAWHTELAERRLDEATQLAVSHALNATTSTYLATAFNENVDASMHDADSLAFAGDTEDSVNAKDTLVATVAAHADILTLVATASASSTITTEASSTAQNTVAVQDIAQKVILKKMELFANQDALKKEAGYSNPVERTDLTNKVPTGEPKEASTTEIVMPSSSSVSIVSAVSTISITAPESISESRQKARAAVMVNVFNRNQKALNKLGITASSTPAALPEEASSTLPAQPTVFKTLENI